MLNYNKIIGNSDVNITLMAMVVGVICGGLAILFRETVELIIGLSFSANEYNLTDVAKNMPFWQIISITTIGGLVVGLIANFFMPVNRSQGMTEVIETALKKNHKISLKTTISSFFINVITLGTGGATGREGPIVHLASGVSGFLFEKFNVQGKNRKVLLGCAAAAAVASAFNAPIAGVFFASELITGSYATAQLLPVVVASVSGAFLSDMVYGQNASFFVGHISEISLYELPFFIILGILCAYFIKLFIFLVNKIFTFAKNNKIPIWLCPAIGGLGVGIIATFFPQIMGDGYFTINQSLAGDLSFQLLLILLFVKLIAVSLTVGFGGGGGVFSPSLFIGAMLGGTFGYLAIESMGYFGIVSENSYSSYSVVGMGALAGGLLGAPISTVFMIFELTNNYILTGAVMVATFVTTRTMQNINVTSFFNWQLKNRGIDLDGSIENIAMRGIFVKDIMSKDYVSVNKNEKLKVVREKLKQARIGDIFVTDDNNILLGDVCLYSMADNAFNTSADKKLTAIDVADIHTQRVNMNDNLEKVIPIYREHSETIVAVVNDNQELVGILHENDVLIAYKNVVVDTRREERM